MCTLCAPTLELPPRATLSVRRTSIGRTMEKGFRIKLSVIICLIAPLFRRWNASESSNRIQALSVCVCGRTSQQHHALFTLIISANAKLSISGIFMTYTKHTPTVSQPRAHVVQLLISLMLNWILILSSHTQQQQQLSVSSNNKLLSDFLYEIHI